MWEPRNQDSVSRGPERNHEALRFSILCALIFVRLCPSSIADWNFQSNETTFLTSLLESLSVEADKAFCKLPGANLLPQWYILFNIYRAWPWYLLYIGHLCLQIVLSIIHPFRCMDAVAIVSSLSTASRCPNFLWWFPAVVPWTLGGISSVVERVSRGRSVNRTCNQQVMPCSNVANPRCCLRSSSIKDELFLVLKPTFFRSRDF